MRRLSIILLVFFQAVFLNIVVPGHTRGIVAMTGKTSVRKIGDLFGGGSGCCQKRGGEESPGQPTRKDRENCAICYVAAALSTPEGIDLSLPVIGQIGLLPVPEPQLIEECRFVRTYDACAPPLPA